MPYLRHLTVAERRYAGGRGRRYDPTVLLTPQGRPRPAPPWSVSAAYAAIQVLDAFKSPKPKDRGRSRKLATILSSKALLRRVLLHIRVRCCASAARLASDIFHIHAARYIPTCTTADPASQHIRSTRQLLERHGALSSSLIPLYVPLRTKLSPPSYTAWLDKTPSLRQRPCKPNGRIRKHLSKWRCSTGGVICFERLADRVKTAYGSLSVLPSAAFLQRFTSRHILDTAVAGPADHYYHVGRGRFLSVSEQCRAFGISAVSPLWRSLHRRYLTPRQAGIALGGAFHPASLECALRASGALDVLNRLPTVTLGTAYTGVCLGAVTCDLLFPGRLIYSHASERCRRLRTLLRHTWGCRGLLPSMVHRCAFSAAAIDAPPVDLFLAGPPCEPFSRRNHHRTDAGYAIAMSAFARSTAYIRRAHPRIVVVENVNEPEAVNAITALLLSIPGYTWHGGPIDACKHGGVPMRRVRHFWVGVAL